MASLSPPMVLFLKCLSANLTAVDTSGQNVFSAMFVLNSPQVFANGTASYDCTNVTAGMWIAGTSAGFTWKIRSVDSISYPAPSYQQVITCTLVDIQNFNYNIDAQETYGGPQQGSKHILFALSDSGMPVFTPTYGYFQDIKERAAVLEKIWTIRGNVRSVLTIT